MLFIDHWRVERTIMWAKRGGRENGAPRFGLKPKANTQWAKWVYHYAQRRVQWPKPEAKMESGKWWCMRWPNNRYEKWKYKHQYQSSWPVGFLFGSGLGSFVQVIYLFWEWVSCNLLELMEFDLCWKVLSFSLFAFALCIFTLKECMHSSIYIVSLHNKVFFKKNPYYPVRGHQSFQW